MLLGIPQGQVVEAAASDERTRALEPAGVEWGEGHLAGHQQSNVDQAFTVMRTHARGNGAAGPGDANRLLDGTGLHFAEVHQATGMLAAPRHWSGCAATPSVTTSACSPPPAWRRHSGCT